MEGSGHSAGHVEDEGSACVSKWQRKVVGPASSQDGKPAAMEAHALARSESRAAGEAHELGVEMVNSESRRERPLGVPVSRDNSYGACPRLAKGLSARAPHTSISVGPWVPGAAKGNAWAGPVLDPSAARRPRDHQRLPC